jgi:hypothetical protein
LKFSGVMAFDKQQTVVINGQEFTVGSQKTIKLRNRSVLVRCVAVNQDEITVQADGHALTLERGQEKAVP